MTNGEGERVFLDTNILVYANIAEAPLHDAALNRIRTSEQAGSALWISRQVLREYLAVLTRPGAFPRPIPKPTLITQVRLFIDRFQVADDTAPVTRHLLALLERFSIGGRQVHDANIVATMQAYGIKRILTHNEKDFDRFSSLISVQPLVP